MKNVNIFIKTLKISFFVFLMFIIFSIPAQACNYGACYRSDGSLANPCVCKGENYLGKGACYFYSYSYCCEGHRFTSVENKTYATCTSGGYTYKEIKCTAGCNHTDTSGSTWQGALGHIESGWKTDDSQHWTVCTRTTNGCVVLALG